MSELLPGRRCSKRGESEENSNTVMALVFNCVCLCVCQSSRNMLVLSLRYVDENWVGIPTSKVGMDPMAEETDVYIYIYSIVAFVKGDQPKQFPTLQVRYKKGANPTLKLLDDTNTVQDTLA